MKMEKKILVAGLGNLLLTDEGVGIHVVRELSKRELPDEVELAEIGTAIFELVRLMEGRKKVIIVDALLADEPPGTIYKLTPDDLKSGKRKLSTSLHQFGLMEALQSAAQTGNKPETVILGITPKDYQTFSTELSSELRGSLPKIVETILEEL